jgi:hypothetical protein
MLAKLDAVRRHVVGNRRRYPRKHLVYDVVLRDKFDEIIFQGKTFNLSRAGVGMTGLPVGHGVAVGQGVWVEITVIPKQITQVASKMKVFGYIRRAEEGPETCNVGIKFHHPLPD